MIDLNHYYDTNFNDTNFNDTSFNGCLFDMNLKKKIPVIYLDLLGDLLQTFDSLVDCINFFDSFDSHLKLMEESFSSRIPLKPFKIMGCLILFPDEEENNVNESNENVREPDNDETKIQTEPIFKYVECVICLTNISNVLFCDCGHICICSECDILKSLDICPMCRVKTTIKRKID